MNNNLPLFKKAPFLGAKYSLDAKTPPFSEETLIYSQFNYMRCPETTLRAENLLFFFITMAGAFAAAGGTVAVAGFGI
ncbi:MAG: hypothetical protein HUK20_06240, partial [Fibrobacter sp.]|nr:hypothetical protein [Fibrobacter sp.]